MQRQSSSVLTEEGFSKIAKIAKDRFGLNLSPTKRSLVAKRLQNRLACNEIDKFEDYIDLLNSNQGLNENQGLIWSLTTNVTQFFREPHHFEILKKEFQDRLIAKAKTGEKVRIWSAGCSTGQETYSILMSIFEAFPDFQRYDVRILATDLDTRVVEYAKTGVYRGSEIEGLSDTQIQKYFRKQNCDFKVRSELKASATFGNLNLIEPFPMEGQFDVIFCRNVAIYFDREVQELVWKRISQQLRLNSILLIGHSERLSGLAEKSFRVIGTTAYRKTEINQNSKFRSPL